MGISPTAGRIALGVTVAAAGIGIGVLNTRAAQDRMVDVIDGKRAEWTSWKTELDREFPTRMLPTSADEARFKTFLADHPAPGFLNVKSEGLRQISIDPWDPHSPADVFGGGTGGAVLGAGFVAALGGAGLNALGTKRGIGALAQGGNMLSIAGGALFGTMLVGSFFVKDHSDLKGEIERSEFHVPTHWSE